MINKTLKSFLLKIPQVKSYVDGVNKIRHENSILNDRLLNIETLISSSRSPLLFSSENDFLTERLMSHPAKVGTTNIELKSISANDINNRVEVAERLIAAYHLAIEDEIRSPLKRDGEDLWTGLLRN